MFFMIGCWLCFDKNMCFFFVTSWSCIRPCYSDSLSMRRQFWRRPRRMSFPRSLSPFFPSETFALVWHNPQFPRAMVTNKRSLLLEGLKKSSSCFDPVMLSMVEWFLSVFAFSSPLFTTQINKKVALQMILSFSSNLAFLAFRKYFHLVPNWHFLLSLFKDDLRKSESIHH